MGRRRVDKNAPRRHGPVVAIKNHLFYVEIADRPEVQERGLMGRRSLDHDAGMLFVFDAPTVAGFWMVNTYVPLDVAFIRADRTIASIEQMAALSSNFHYATEPVLFALEVTAGEFARRGINPGDKMVLPQQIRAAAE